MSSCHMLIQRMPDDVATALGLILRHLAGSGYRFTTPTPLTHQRVLAHRNRARQGVVNRHRGKRVVGPRDVD